MFTQVLGFFIFLFIFLMGFSMLLFLGLFVGYWLTLLGLEQVAPKLVYKMIGHKEGE
ncbi:MAG: hypothetical protein NXI09_03575 [Bacteroidetes bacterium]|nr:hypothetical protein [Bacteroidota bacterium]